MNYTIDAHTKREKIKDPDSGKPIIDMTDDAGRTIDKPDEYLKKNPSRKLKPMARVKITQGFILRANDAMVGFYETKEKAMKAMEKEKKNPSVLPGMSLTIEAHTKREKQFDSEDKPIIDSSTGRVKEKLTPGFQLRTDNKVVMWAEKREDLVKKIQEVRGMSDPVAAEEAARPKKPDKKREPKSK